jgi:enoyl-CoA hydratase/carnithine racemase
MEFVRLSMEEGIAEVRLARGKVNALDDLVVEELSACFRQLADDPEVRGAILTGTGKFFSFGFDIPRFLGYSREAFTRYLVKFTTLYRELFSYPKPLVAALNGHAVAGGCMLSTTCDARIMVGGKAKIGLNEIGFGSSVFAGSAGMLAFWTGRRRAQEILYGGNLYSAEEAQALGLIDAIVTDAGLLDAARAVVRQHASREPAAFRSVKGLLRRPVIEDMLARESQSIREFVEIWYSERTWRNLQEITIHP